MRVAVHIPPDHPEHGGGVDGPAVIAYRLGRVEDGVHNAPVGHPAQPLEEFVANLASQARDEYPGCEVRIERLIDNGDGTASWIDADEFDPDRHSPQGAGNAKAAELHVVSDQSSEG